MVTFVLKRLGSGSVVRVPADEPIQGMAKSLGKMIITHANMIVRGADTTVDGVSCREIIADCKERFSEHLAANLSKALEEMGEGWVFEDLLLPTDPEDY